MFQPSKKLPPVEFDADPKLYHAPQKVRPGDASFVMSRSEIEKFAVCPRKWVKGIPREVTKAMKWGDIFDAVVLTPKRIDRDYAITPETYETEGMKCPKCGSITDAAKCAKCKVERVKTKVTKPWSGQSETCQEWIAEQQKAGKTVVDNDVLSEAWKAHARLVEDEDIRAILVSSKRQVRVNVEWHCPDTGIIVPFKAMLDLVPPRDVSDTIWDLKSASTAEPKKWQKQVYNDGLFFQAGAYLLAMNAASGLNYRQFGNVIVESDAPYEPAHRVLSVEFLQLGINDFNREMARYCRCLKSGNFPGYDNDIVEPLPYMIMN